MWTLSQAAARVGGRIEGADPAFDSVGADSRRNCVGQLFVALKGERFDAHQFVAQAAASGAVAALVDHLVDTDIPQWVVEDTRLALGRLAGAWREELGGRVIAVTGSNGKTTCKEMIAAVLSRAGAVLATRGNLNNDIGMPLTLLAARGEDFLVLEMGANHPGEIAYLTDIARPSVAIITNAGRAHLEGFGSVAGVARSKGEITRGLLPDGTLIIPSDSPFTGLWRDLAAGHRVLTCGLDAGADVRTPADGVTTTWDDRGFRTCFDVSYGEVDMALELPLAGMHNVRNALLAVAAAFALGIAPEAAQSGIGALEPVAGRLQPRGASNGVRVIDDSYNANPDSLQAAIEVLTGLPGRHWLVLGDLAELGPDAESLHREMGAAARTAGVDALHAVGELSAAAVSGFGKGGRHFEHQEQLIAALREHLGPGDLVLVKGSRRAAMDRVADALCAGGGA
ncbi:MAG: UDP-N-acetylmuramoyl-tripeptide--D-alanyl-D-alanine ligase [Pseudomonadota bacterium]|nr:UDP-N-acetylmuramoyl-tripeptide--D-alanyl-D-alanine ligase [Pseudomonadota bacterium]